MLPAEQIALLAALDDALADINNCDKFADVLNLAADRLQLTNADLGAIIAADETTVWHWRHKKLSPATRREASLRRVREHVISDDVFDSMSQRLGIVNLPEVRTQGERRVVDMTVDMDMVLKLSEMCGGFDPDSLRLDHADTRIFHALNACRAALIR